MSNETIDNTMTHASTSTGNGLNGGSGVVHRVAQKAHETVDRVEQQLAAGSDKVYSAQEEYSSYARDQIKANPLATVAGAFVIGLLLGKILR